MTSKEQEKQARIVVFERLRSFFGQLQQQLGASTDEFRKRIEAKIIGGKKES